MTCVLCKQPIGNEPFLTFGNGTCHVHKDCNDQELFEMCKADSAVEAAAEAAFESHAEASCDGSRPF